jgi:hypothetical protein
VSIFDELIENARSDTDLLCKLDAQGDAFSVPRDVEFLVRCPSQDRADVVAGFINDYQFGTATVQESDGEYSVLTVIRMPIKQHALLCVSGFMASISHLFESDLDGWGCLVQKPA